MLSTTVELALGHHQAGRFQEAERLYKTSLVQTPNDQSAWYLLGVLARQSGQHPSAIACLAKAIELKPDWAEAHFNLGLTHRQLRDWDSAITSHFRAIAIYPDFADAHRELASALRERGRFDEAAAAYRHFLKLQPNAAEVHNDLGELLAIQGKSAEALVCFQSAARLRPDSPEIQTNIGNVYREQGNKSQAIAAFARAIVLKPDLDATHCGLGSVYQENGEIDRALACFHRALELNPQNAFAWNNLGNAFKAQGKINSAIDCFRRALSLQPGFRCAHSNLIFALYFAPDYDASAIYEEHRRWNDQYAAALSRNIAPHANDRSAERPLRLGYVSYDFRDHVTSFATLPLLSAHDRHQFEIYCYSSCRAPDYLTDQFRANADVWRDLSAMTDAHAAATIRSDQIDILVDLTMHLDGGRPLIFARKPAPVQICWAACPGTTGLTAIDYRLTDPHLDPPALDDCYYSEESIRQPESFWCYDPRSTTPEVNPLPATTSGHITFGSLNNFCKINPAVLQLWARVLNSVDRSRLLLLCPESSHREHILQTFERDGVTRDRITFVGRCPRPDYLALYHQIDIGLDPFPYNGHTTSLDALWMGVPIVTLVGNTVVGRAGLSQLTNLGLPKLIAHTPEQYINIARNLASDVLQLQNLRSTLRGRMQCSPLMDYSRFARHIEAAYRSVWRRWCA